MAPYVLQQNPTKDDTSWHFTAPPTALAVPKNRANPGKLMVFTAEKITIEIAQLPANRILRSDDASKFILLSFGGLRFPGSTLRDMSDYIARLLKTGIYLNGVQYRFYHHSNSQLRGRSCFVRQANSDEELDQRIYALGDFGNIMNAAKRAKRIGLLFSEAQMDLCLDPKYVQDIPDIKSGDEVFSDGCGLASKRLLVQLSRSKKIIFRGERYTPTIIQIRYLGYKGVLMRHPELDGTGKPLAQFRKSMKKFKTDADWTFSVVNFSKPYTFGRLNNDVIVLLSSLGITNDKLRDKQQEYFRWIRDASEDPIKAVDFLCALQNYDLAERVLLDGLDNPAVKKEVRKAQLSEVAGFRSEKNRPKSRTIVRDSRRLFGVCDPYGVLKEGQVHIRITAARKGPSTPIHGDVLVVRNPCLHPGDCLKLRAVSHRQLNHLVDCIVFSSVARPGHHSAPSMSSGGDLDGDEYFVCWDKDLVPSRVVESYDYPPNKEQKLTKLQRSHLVDHFAMYSGAGVARVSALHAKWVRASPLGALCPECQELNALHSQSVDGARVKIPDRLTNPPEVAEGSEPFILDILEEDRGAFADSFTAENSSVEVVTSMDTHDGEELLQSLLQSKQSALSEFEIFTFAHGLARRRSIDIAPFLNYLDFSALTAQEKHALTVSLGLSREKHPFMWNSLLRSDILDPRVLYQRALDRPFSIQRLYSSKSQGLYTFFEFLRMATQEYTRKLLILKTDERFSIGIFMRGTMPWNEDADVDENVVVCSFMPQTASTTPGYRPCTKGYRLHLGDDNFQLYNKDQRDTFVFIKRAPRAADSEVAVSIALQKISAVVQRQLGRLRTAPVTALELHVVSNRDREAHQLFDLWFDHVPTEEFVKRLSRRPVPYQRRELTAVDWSQVEPRDLQASFFQIEGLVDTSGVGQRVPPVAELDQRAWPQLGKSIESLRRHDEPSMACHLATKTAQEISAIMDFAIEYNAEEEIFMIFKYVARSQPPNLTTLTLWMERYPSLAFALLDVYPPAADLQLNDALEQETHAIIRGLIRCANSLGLPVLSVLDKIRRSVQKLDDFQYYDILMLASMSIRSQHLVGEILLVLNDFRIDESEGTNLSPSQKYGNKLALSIAFERAEEAADECPCDDWGRPRKQNTSPMHVKLYRIPDHGSQIRAEYRVDTRPSARIHSHIRLQAASKPTNEWITVPVLDGIVVVAAKGEFRIELMHPPPPETEEMDWNLYHAGSVATSKAMMDALQRLVEQGPDCCSFADIILGNFAEGEQLEGPTPQTPAGLVLSANANLNPSQIDAVSSCTSQLSLIWGPPGTGKTTVVVQILHNLLKEVADESLPKILMSASTHNAVDNVLERFLKLNETEQLLTDQQILRVATDQSKVHEHLRSYTIDARVGGDLNENNHLAKKARERVDNAILVFSTCAGAGLGTLRKQDFDIAIIDEASQITEPTALIPLVKGIRKAVMVGDHVQLRPTVRKMGRVLEVDVSLLERLYTRTTHNDMRKTMLDVQYRSPRELMAFPSSEFYEGRLQTGLEDSEKVLGVLRASSFPWPRTDGSIKPTVFVPCGTEEDMGGMSKSNLGQVELIEQILPLLRRPVQGADDGLTAQLKDLTITVLSPYTKQIHTLRSRLPGDVQSYTIDSFQGRESDIIIFTSVRCNPDLDIGFLEDARRLNVMWTRARIALIIIGHRPTLSSSSALWSRALAACHEVEIETKAPAA